MPISRAQVRHVASLARLALEPDEENTLAAQLETIVAWVDEMAALDLSGVPPTAHPLEEAGTFRDDRALNAPDVDDLLRNAPDRVDGYFRVPRILEGS